MLPLENNIEILVFTYNRANALRNVLQKFSDSPFKRCRFTVLDNSSTDGTSLVCAEFENIFPNFRSIRHPKNIGGLANFLRAVELASAEYCWIICDDDDYDFAHASDLVNKVQNSEVDLISVGVVDHPLPGGYQGRVKAFAENYPFFLGHSLVPALIFRTKLFTSELIRKGYDNIHTMFPHFPFLINLFESDVSIYVSKNKIITPGTSNMGYSRFGYLRGWLQSCVTTRNTRTRRAALKDVFNGNQFWLMLLYSYLTERAYRPSKRKEDFWGLVRTAATSNAVIFFKIFISSPLLFTPRFLHEYSWARYLKYRADQGKPLPNFDEER